MNTLLNVIGVLIYFINRFANRRKKTVKFSFKYWLSDNWPEASTVILIDLALMILLFSEGTEVNFDKLFENLPFGLSVAAVPFMSLLLGLGLSALFYKIFKHKVNAKG